jgi:hypothetical protein
MSLFLIRGGEWNERTGAPLPQSKLLGEIQKLLLHPICDVVPKIILTAATRHGQHDDLRCRAFVLYNRGVIHPVIGPLSKAAKSFFL